MAKAVPVKVRLAGNDVNRAGLTELLEVLHTCVVMEVIQEGKYSERQRTVLLTSMRQKLAQHQCKDCFRDDVSEGMGGNSYA